MRHAVASIGTPGIAASALTVGATDTDGLPAFFSGRGPTQGSYRAKPDITAPGVSITGARFGTDEYWPMSGTSQASPHVAAIAKVVTPAAGDIPETMSLAGTPELTLDRDRAYTIDAREARQLKPVTVDGARTTVSTMSVYYRRQDVQRDGGISDGIYATGAQLARGQVFVQPTTATRSGRTVFETHWELDRGDDRYAVVLGGPTVADPPTYRAKPSTFARIDADYRSFGGRPDNYLTYRMPETELVYLTQAWVHKLPAPTRRTEWVTANVRWRQCVAGPRRK